jgi:hypothetical protein
MIYVKDYLSEYGAWKNARLRCHNPEHPDFADYGGRGILMCVEWREKKVGFHRFIEHIGRKPSPELTLDRIDNSKGYQPGNVRWADRSTQAANQRARSKRTVGRSWTRITAATALAIYNAEGDATEVARRFNTTSGVVFNIRAGSTWSKVTGRVP